MKLCILSDDFPSYGRQTFVFVEQLVIALADLGVEVSVIAPQSIARSVIRHIPLMPEISEYKTLKGNTYTVYRHKMLSVGNSKALAWIARLSKNLAIKNTLKNIGISNIDALYGHFWHNAYALSAYARKYNKPLFVACGEGDNALEHLVASLSSLQLRTLRETISGMISVSTENKRKSIELGFIDEDSTIVLPNAVNKSVFYPLDKDKCRSQLGITEQDFVISFVGAFIHRKGSARVANAITEINNPNLKSLFMGKALKGDDATPRCNNIVYMGVTKHSELPIYLSASDVFVLPTLKEGCCNAIVEALSCGLPVISSDGAFNDDILDETCSIRINPQDETAIKDAICVLMNDRDKCHKMSEAALEKSSTLSITSRASKIKEFIENKIY